MRKHDYPVAPMTAMLQGAEGTTRFHMPGHKGRLDAFDVTELPRTDDLYAPRGAILEAERMAAASCGAARTLMLSGGATAGLMAMLLTCVAPGEVLIAPRGVHHAVVSACVFGDIDAVFVEEAHLLEALSAYPQARAVLVTRPDYFGRCMDIGPIVRAAHQSGALVLVDEAHGAHFPWWDRPLSAGRLGADAWVQSAHKTLPALTGAAWLHLSGAVDPVRARHFLRMVQSSSPSFPILQSLDEAREWMDAYGVWALSNLSEMLSSLRGKINGTAGYAAPPSDDPTRLVIETRGRGYTGFEVQEGLAAHGIDVEMADADRIVCICTVSDERRAFQRLFAGLRSLAPREALRPVPLAMPPPGGRALTLRAAALSPHEPVPLESAVGRVAGVSAGMYPPGMPMVLPGERITAACVRALRAIPAPQRFGVENDCVGCVR